ncbi:MAG: hypothetical protein JJU29_07920 [Verrucomicrobia bacterium]|nr:hypothetical protein [Verrucomicrobiota bacterium]MCH8511948.1 hypothetical protein [Kiritimatiellia bacterium]
MKTTYSSPKIAEKMLQQFGNETKTVTVEMKHKREVGGFLRKIEKAHQNAGNGTLRFKSVKKA